MVAKVKRAKVAGTSKAAAVQREALFIEAYLTNGENATQAGIACGFSAKTAYSSGQRMLKRVEAKIAERKKQVVLQAGLTTDRWAQETGYRAHFDPRELYDRMGNLIPIHLLPDHVARAISLELPMPDGGKLKTPNKDAALADVGKHLGVFREDNAQKKSDIKVLVQLLG